MDIIREEEIRARRERVEAEEKRNNPLKYALLDLEQQKKSIVDALVKSARESFVKGDTRLLARADIKGESSRILIGIRQAQDLIATWLQEVDPRVNQPIVKIGPDCSGNLQYAAEIAVMFTVQQ